MKQTIRYKNWTSKELQEYSQSLLLGNVTEGKLACAVTHTKTK